MNSRTCLNLTTTIPGEFRRLEVFGADIAYDTCAEDVTYNLGMLRRGNCPMPGTIVAELLHAPAMAGQRLLDESHRTGKEMRFRLTEDAVIVHCSGFVSSMQWIGGPCHIRTIQHERTEWKTS